MTPPGSALPDCALGDQAAPAPAGAVLRRSNTTRDRTPDLNQLSSALTAAGVAGDRDIELKSVSTQQLGRLVTWSHSGRCDVQDVV